MFHSKKSLSLLQSRSHNYDDVKYELNFPQKTRKTQLQNQLHYNANN